MATTNNPFQDFLSGSGNWYKLLLSEMPMEQYYSSPTGQSFYQSDITDPYSRSNPRKQRYFDQSYQDVYRDYMGETGRALREGQPPQHSCSSYREIPGQDDTHHYHSQPEV